MNIIKIRKKIFSKICKIRFFELQVQKLREQNIIRSLIYLSLGQESIAASISEVFKNPYVFFQHRGHAQYLSFGGDEKKLANELLGKKSGSNKGMGGSPCIFDLKKKIYGHVGLIGDQVPVAVGFSMIKRKSEVLCFFGDGAAEEDYVLAALGTAATKKLKILFICDDNNLSVLTPIKDRRSWKIENVAKSMGMPAVSIMDDPISIYNHTKKLKNKLPALINIKTCREFWHEGSGKDKPSKDFWNRFEIEKKNLIKQNQIGFVEKEISKQTEWAKKLWQKQLQKR